MGFFQRWFGPATRLDYILIDVNTNTVWRDDAMFIEAAMSYAMHCRGAYRASKGRFKKVQGMRIIDKKTGEDLTAAVDELIEITDFVNHSRSPKNTPPYRHCPFQQDLKRLLLQN